MSRKNTIILALMVNAGLLLILFATALPQQEEDESLYAVNESHKALIHQNTIEQSSSLVKATLPRDEVDLVLSEWNIKPGEGSLEPVSETNIKLTKNSGNEKPQATIQPLSIESKEAVSKDWIQVTVKKGDVLEKIAKTHNTTVQEITKLNNLSASSTLKIGQILKVPNKKDNTLSDRKNSEKVKEKKEEKPTDCQEYYTVKSGDSPWAIAAKNNIKLEDLLKLNKLDDEKARKLKPGDRLKIK